MNGFWMALVVLEIAGIAAVIHLWRRRQMSWLGKLGWTVFLLIPVMGLIFYGFVSLNPEPHGEEPTGGVTGA